MKTTAKTKMTKTTQTATNKELSAGLAEITETTEMTKTTGIRGAKHGFPKQRSSGASRGAPLTGSQVLMSNKMLLTL